MAAGDLGSPAKKLLLCIEMPQLPAATTRCVLVRLTAADVNPSERTHRLLNHHHDRVSNRTLA